MSPARIPEGSVFIPRRRGENVALQLLDAAAEVGADRDLSVRTTNGGYHVFQEVADRYLENLGVDTDDEDDETEDETTQTEKTVEEEEAEAAAKEAADKAAEEQEVADVTLADGSKAPVGDDGIPVLPVVQELEPLPVTVESTRAEIDDYGKGLTPAVDTTKAATKADAIALLEDARKTPDAE